MNLIDLPNVSQLAKERQAFQDMADAAELGLINLSIGSRVADESMCAVVKPTIVTECMAQIARIDRQLRQVGVKVD